MTPPLLLPTLHESQPELETNEVEQGEGQHSFTQQTGGQQGGGQQGADDETWLADVAHGSHWIGAQIGAG
jgi:hypothetical protein